MTCKQCHNSGLVTVWPADQVAFVRGELPEKLENRVVDQHGSLRPRQPTVAACDCPKGDRWRIRPGRGKDSRPRPWLPVVWATRLVVPKVSEDITADVAEWKGAVGCAGDFDDWNRGAQ